jgi:phage baseplate assembly protein W
MDVSLEWHSDFALDAAGDLLVVDGDDEVRQRLERRLFTAEKGYVWHPDYGAGLPQKIGSPLTSEYVKAICMAQLNLEASVAPYPPAQLSVAAADGGRVSIDIKYWSVRTGASVSFTITS